jgi:hypothetical protein
MDTAPEMAAPSRPTTSGLAFAAAYGPPHGWC